MTLPTVAMPLLAIPLFLVAAMGLPRVLGAMLWAFQFFARRPTKLMLQIC
jgi:hypothetical protein